MESLPTDFYQRVEKYIPTLMLVAVETRLLPDVVDGCYGQWEAKSQAKTGLRGRQKPLNMLKKIYYTTHRIT